MNTQINMEPKYFTQDLINTMSTQINMEHYTMYTTFILHKHHMYLTKI